jgi:outer membrane lipoprotein-sorting protein
MWHHQVKINGKELFFAIFLRQSAPMKHINVFVCALLLWTGNAQAQPAVPQRLSPAEQAQVTRVEQYLNDLKSVAANFMQIEDSGYVRHGWLGIQRPGKMRVNYDLPDKDFIVVDGSMVRVWDDGLKSQSNIPLEGSIAYLILRNPIRLSGDVTITKLERFPNKLEVTLVATDAPSDGQLTLILEDNPLQLRQWRVIDAQSKTTGVNLQNAVEGVSFPSNTFSFRPPSFNKTGSPVLDR